MGEGEAKLRAILNEHLDAALQQTMDQAVEYGSAEWFEKFIVPTARSFDSEAEMYEAIAGRPSAVFKRPA